MFLITVYDCTYAYTVFQKKFTLLLFTITKSDVALVLEVIRYLGHVKKCNVM